MIYFRLYDALEFHIPFKKGKSRSDYKSIHVTIEVKFMTLAFRKLLRGGSNEFPIAKKKKRMK